MRLNIVVFLLVPVVRASWIFGGGGGGGSGGGGQSTPTSDDDLTSKRPADAVRITTTAATGSTTWGWGNLFFSRGLLTPSTTDMTLVDPEAKADTVMELSLVDHQALECILRDLVQTGKKNLLLAEETAAGVTSAVSMLEDHNGKLDTTHETMTQSHALLIRYVASLSQSWASFVVATMFISIWAASRLMPQLAPLYTPVAFLTAVWYVHMLATMWMQAFFVAMPIFVMGVLVRSWLSRRAGHEPKDGDGNRSSQQVAHPAAVEPPPTSDEWNHLLVAHDTPRTHINEVLKQLRRLRAAGSDQSTEVNKMLLESGVDINNPNALESSLSVLDISKLKALALMLRRVKTFPKIPVTGAGRNKKSIASDVTSAVIPILFPSSK